VSTAERTAEGRVESRAMSSEFNFRAFMREAKKLKVTRGCREKFAILSESDPKARRSEHSDHLRTVR
jgi:hypothetical protein